MKKNIYLFGGDGYIGWPLAVKLAILKPDYKVTIFDNFFRRKVVKSLSSDSLTKVKNMQLRIKNFSKIYSQNNIEFKKVDIVKQDITKFFKSQNIDYIYNLAQQSSAPYSMLNEKNALFTAYNNEIGNLKILHSIRDYCPKATYVKLGSFGEYCTTNIDIPEGFFKPKFKNKTSLINMPYPRQSDDFYHASKINDSNYIHVACKNWNLKVIEIMQATIFGITTKETSNSNLFTRFDYDQFFGTVLNRFIVQAVQGKNLTVYGSGKQRTGLMNLQESVNSMSSLLNDKKFIRGHNIINHVTEKNYSINEIAAKVIKIAKLFGINKIKISRKHNPRYENIKNKLNYKILSSYSDKIFKENDFENHIKIMFREVIKNRNKIKSKVIYPTFKW